jgi:hypothetical protein
MTVRRTVRHATWVVETEGLSEKEHERRVTWTESNMEDAGRKIDSAFVSMVISDGNGDVITLFGSGSTSSEEVLRIAKELTKDAG